MRKGDSNAMNDTEVTDLTPAQDWKRRSDEEIAEMNEKSAINFYGVSGLLTAVLGGILGLFTTMHELLLAIPLGFIVMGIGEILRYLRTLAKK